MKKFYILIAAAFCALIGFTIYQIANRPTSAIVVDADGNQVSVTNPQRIITVGSDITEILFALDMGDKLIATDKGSVWPKEIGSRSSLGQRRKLSAEGILAQQPDLILLSRNFGPPEILDILQASNATVLLVPEGRDREGVREKIRLIGHALSVHEKAEFLISSIDAEIDQVSKAIAHIPQEQRKRVVFVHSVAGGKVSGAAGGDTPADLIIRLAGGVNALASMSGYKLASAEALIAGAPDVVLMTRGPDNGRNPDEVFAAPALKGTPAERARALIQFDASFMLGYGPRTGAAIRALALALYPTVEGLEAQ